MNFNEECGLEAEFSERRKCDLLDEIRKMIQCSYISDMRYSPWLERARDAMSRMDLSAYTLKELDDAANYLYAGKEGLFRLRCVIKVFGRLRSKEKRHSGKREQDEKRVRC